MIFKTVTVHQLVLYASIITQDAARRVRCTWKARAIDDIQKNESYKITSEIFWKKLPELFIS